MFGSLKLTPILVLNSVANFSLELYQQCLNKFFGLLLMSYFLLLPTIRILKNILCLIVLWKDCSFNWFSTNIEMGSKFRSYLVEKLWRWRRLKKRARHMKMTENSSSSIGIFSECLCMTFIMVDINYLMKKESIEAKLRKKNKSLEKGVLAHNPTQLPLMPLAEIW